jgi:uncharacterized protein DUF6766
VRRLWKHYSLSIVLGTLFLLSWVLQTWTGWIKFVAGQKDHGQPAAWFGASGYIWDWAQATLENWQSEFLQLLAFVILTAYFIHKGSHESKDSDEEMMATLQRIETRLVRLENAGGAPARAEKSW